MFGCCLYMYRMGSAGVVCILGGWVCSVGPLCAMCVHRFILGCFVCIWKPVGVLCIHSGLCTLGVVPCGALSEVWVLSVCLEVVCIRSRDGVCTDYMLQDGGLCLDWQKGALHVCAGAL